MLDQVEDLTGVRMKGMGGAGPQVATEDTVDLLAEAGFLYQSDWSIDDQPFPLRVKSGKLIAMPYPVEINDVTALSFAEADDFFEIVKAQFDRLYAEGAESGRVMTISLHPPLIGQPQRIRYLEKILDYIMGAPGVWQTTGAELAEYYMTNYYDSALARLDSLRAGGVR